MHINVKKGLAHKVCLLDMVSFFWRHESCSLNVI